MTLRELFAPSVLSLRLRGRRVWASRERTHVEMRRINGVDPEEVRSEIETIDGVAWARHHPHTRRLVVAYDPERVNPEMIARRVNLAELEAGCHPVALTADHFEHPGDIEPIARAVVELIADAVGLSAGLALRILRVGPHRIEIDLAALLRTIEEIPSVRHFVERRAGVATTELALTLVSAINRSLLHSWTGPVVRIVHRSINLRALLARRDLWARREARLCAQPDAYVERSPPVPRATPVSPGPVEAYTDTMVSASLGGFGLGVASTHSVARASVALFGGIPRPARMAREAFVSHLGRRLAQRGVLVFHRAPFQLLDRIDCVVVAGALLRPKAPVFGALRLEPQITAEARAFVAAVRRSGATLVVPTRHPDDVRWADLRWAKADVFYDGDGLGAVREMQRAGRTVMYVGTGCDRAYEHADLALGIEDGDELPWGAHAMSRPLSAGGLDDAVFLVEALRRARAASVHGVQLSALDLATSALLSTSSGLLQGTPRQVMAIADAASLIAVLDAIRLARSVGGIPSFARGDPVPWHALETSAVLGMLGSSEGGLSFGAAEERRHAAATPPSRPATFARMFLAELDNPLAPVLGAGAGLSAIIGSVTDSALIAAVVALNALIGGAQHYRIEQVLQSLQDGERKPARARRGGRVVEVPADSLVPGDVIELEAGEAIPADCRILRAHVLEVDESSVTGESLPVRKSAEPSRASAVAERSSMLYAGTSVASGSTVAVVVAVGEDVETRRGLHPIDGATRPGGVEERLHRLTAFTVPAAALSGMLLTAYGMLRGRSMREVLGAGISLAVAAVPEGLPVLATAAQIAAAGRLSDRGVLVRNPRAVEALGRVDVLFADKTGTLTEGRIRLVRVSDGVEVHGLDGLPSAHREVVAIARRASPSSAGRLPHVTDRALIDAADDLGVESRDGQEHWQRLLELPFESERGFHAALGRGGYGHTISVKGAPEVVLPRCTRWRPRGEDEPLDAPARARLRDEAGNLAREGLRVLAVAERGSDEPEHLDDDDVEELVFRGYVAFADPVRPSAKKAVGDLRRAGVDIAMITGDHPSTADAIAAELGISDDGALTGPELDELDDDELEEVLERVRIFARVTPSQKVRIVAAMQRRGKTVAMTGDGANDAPAIRLADVGIAVGKRATTAARDAADIIVVAEQIESIVDALLEGRALWSSVRDAVAILVGGNLGEISYTLAGGLIDGTPPLNARQLLLVNLLTDALPALAVALRPPRTATPEQLLDEGPDASLGRVLTRDIAWRATLTAAAATGAWLPARYMGSPARAGTVGLLALVGSQLGQTLVLGGKSKLVAATSLGSLALMVAAVQTPVVSHFFGCRPLGPVGLAQAGIATAAATALSAFAPSVADRLEGFLGKERLARWAHSAPVRAMADGTWLPKTLRSSTA